MDMDNERMKLMKNNLKDKLEDRITVGTLEEAIQYTKYFWEQYWSENEVRAIIKNEFKMKIQESAPTIQVHSPTDLPEPVKESVKPVNKSLKNSKLEITKIEGDLIVYAMSMSLDNSVKTLEGLLTFVTTYNKTCGANWSPERILKLCSGLWDERVKQDVEKAKKKGWL